MGKASRRALVGFWIQQANAKAAQLPPTPTKIEDPGASAAAVSVSDAEKAARDREAAQAAEEARLQAQRDDLAAREQAAQQAEARARSAAPPPSPPDAGSGDAGGGDFALSRGYGKRNLPEKVALPDANPIDDGSSSPGGLFLILALIAGYWFYGRR